MRCSLIVFTSLLASVAALRAPGRAPAGHRAEWAPVGRRFVLSASLLAPSAATAATLSSQLAKATGLDSQMDAGQRAPKPIVQNLGNDADQRCVMIV